MTPPQHKFPTPNCTTPKPWELASWELGVGLTVALLVVAAGCSPPPSPSLRPEGVRRVVADARGMT